MNISPSVENGLWEWASRSNPNVFALALDGRAYGYSYCADIRCSGNEEATALYACTSKSQGSECVIYARDGRYVWNNELIKQPVAQARAPEKQTAVNSGVRPIAISWEGYASLVNGTMKFDENGHNGVLELAMDDQTPCKGNYSFTEKGKGNWFLGCQNGPTANGTFETTGKNGGITAAGKDSQGRRVTMIIGE